MSVPHTLPAPDGGHGCPVMSWAMLKWLKEAGHDVSLFAFSPTESAREPGRVQARAHLQALGVPLFETEPSAYLKQLPTWRLRLPTARKLVAPRLDDYHAESAGYRNEWRQCVAAVKPDALFLYTTAAAALAQGTFANLPRLASLVDLDHEARELKRALRPRSLRNQLRNSAERWQDRRLPQATIEILKDCDVVIEHSAASSEWLNERGVPARYLPNPVASQPLAEDWAARRERRLAQSPIKRILMIGYLRGVATQSGLHLLADEILPALTRLPITGEWEVHIVGGGELTSELKAKLAEHPKVRLRGFVENLTEEYQRAHLTLVAVSEKLGFRTRLVEAFAHAAPCVVHANNSYGMPELRHERNSLLADGGRGLAEAIAQILNDDALRIRLGRNARQTYDEQLSLPVVMNRMYQMLEACVSEKRKNNSNAFQPTEVGFVRI